MVNHTYIQAIQAAARQWPKDLALCYKGETAQKLTYEALDAYSSRIAETLAKAGCKPGMFIPLLLNRGLDCVVWALGVVKAGAAAVPLAGDIPLARARYIFEDTGAPFILAHQDLAEKLPDCPCEIVAPNVWESGAWESEAWESEAWESEAWETGTRQKAGDPVPVNPNDPMLLFYTSGTTGRPKGVAITHANVLGFAGRHAALHDIGPGTRVAAYATVSFDAFILDVWAPLVAGARVYLLGQADRMSIVALHRYFLRHKIAFSFLTTRLGEEYMRAFENPHLKRLVTGGEVLREFVPRSYEVMNLYGPTETTVYVTACPVTKVLEDYPLGHALPGMRVMVLDDAGAPCPPGRTGEICISGDQVSTGYVNRPEETGKTFTANPLFDPEIDDPAFSRMYRTGDAGETDDAGRIWFRGRMDLQIKIRGFRIEPTEVEAALMEYPGVDHACVRGGDRVTGEAYLAAWFTRKPNPSGPAEDPGGDGFLLTLKAWLQQTLPEQMVPRYITEVAEFPLNPNGKVDVSALPDPAGPDPKGPVKKTGETLKYEGVEN